MNPLEQFPTRDKSVDNIVVFVIWFSIIAASVSLGIWQHSWSFGFGVFFCLLFRAYKL